MTRTLFLHSCALMAAAILSLSACIKPGGHVIFPNPDYYRIDSIFTNQDTGKVAYNAKGAPVSLTFLHPGTSYCSYLFWYDNQDRLTDQIGHYGLTAGENSFDTWHRYTYAPHKRLPATDTVFAFGLIGPRDPLPDPRGIRDIRFIVNFDQFDAQGRITKATISNPGETRIYNYYYNGQGNAWKITVEWLGSGLGRTATPTIIYPVYDNKVNPRLLHSTWQLSDLHYSRNNPFTAGSYNVYGLPSQVFRQEWDRAVLGMIDADPVLTYRH